MQLLQHTVANEEIIKNMNKIQSHSVSHPTSFVQYAGVIALKSDQSFIKKMVEEFRARRDILVKGLDELGLEYAPPMGAFYVFVNVGMDGLKFCEEMLKREFVALTPGEAFGKAYKEWVRISYATSRENIREFILRLERFQKNL